MATINKIIRFLEKAEIPVKKIPLLVWDKKTEDGIQKKFYNMDTVKIGNSAEEVLGDGQEYIEVSKKSKDIYRYYSIYVPDLNGVLLGRAVISSKAVREMDIDNYKLVTNGRFSKENIENFLRNTNVIRHWEKAGEIFITADKKYIYKDHKWQFMNNHYVWIADSEYYIHDKISGKAPFKIQNIPMYECGVNDEHWMDISKPFLRFFPQFCNFGVNSYGDISVSSSNFKLFLNYKEPRKTESKTQKEVDELVKIPLPEVSYYDKYWQNAAFVQKVKPGVCVLRTMLTDHTGKQMIDCARIYITDKKVLACRPRSDGEWISMTLKSCLQHWDMPLEYLAKEETKGTKLEYLIELSQKVENRHRVKFIFTLLTYPVIEQLAKAGLEDIVIDEINSTFFDKGIRPFEQIFGKLSNNGNLLSNLGVNKYQFKHIVSYMIGIKDIRIAKGDSRHGYYYDFTPLKYLKDILGDNISSYDNQTFDLLFKMFIEIDDIVKHSSYSYWANSTAKELVTTLERISKLYGFNTLRKMVPKCLLIFKEDMEEVEKEQGYNWRNSAINRYNDYISIVSQLEDIIHFKANFDSKSDIETMHNLAIDVFNSKIIEINEKKFAKEIKKCDKWLYNGENFVVIAPKIAEDIAFEGITLHHCVKGYISKVTEGQTNIMFIREINEPDKPFFTVEITNNAVIQQVHGFGNKNANTEEGLEAFVKEWAKAKDLKMSNFNKVR